MLVINSTPSQYLLSSSWIFPGLGLGAWPYDLFWLTDFSKCDLSRSFTGQGCLLEGSAGGASGKKPSLPKQETKEMWFDPWVGTIS